MSSKYVLNRRVISTPFQTTPLFNGLIRKQHFKPFLQKV